MGDVFIDVAIIIIIASLFAIFLRSIRQPLILAYIATGIILGPISIIKLHDVESLRSFAQVGITLMLFMVGLELKLDDFRSIGPTAILAGLGQVLITFLAGFYLATLLGFSAIVSSYIAIALTFSSTIMIVKLLSDKKDLTSLYGKISISILLIQDFAAVIILMGLSAFSKSTKIDPIYILIVIGKGCLFIAWIYLISKTILPWIIRIAAKSTETLFLFSLAWVFGVVGIISSPLFGFSIEMGGFLAGLSLASFPHNFQIMGKIRPLRDFFITIFFVLLGFESSFKNLEVILIPAIIFSIFVILLKPYILSFILGGLGFRKRTSFFSGISIGQVSEFSLTILFFGNKLGHISVEVISLIIIVSIISFGISSSLIQNTNIVYKFLESFFIIPQWKEHVVEKYDDLGELKNHIVLIGGHQMGGTILRSLEKNGEQIIVVDFDPNIINSLKQKNITHLLGDILDIDVQEKVQLKTARLVISTINDMDDNIALIKKMNKENRRAKIIVVAYESEEARELYEAGADYVVMPHLSGGMHLAKIINGDNLDKVEKFKSQDFMNLG
ncbi:potassium transporter Kef [Candidatus Levyibacteriota bacterium]|nr:sodium:proton exchanger [Candidatus Levybacteria bacterium]GDX62076.1 potassium transporter Kef [Candidatus Levybacteria bacterium]